MSQSAREHWRIVPCQYVLKPPPGGLTCKLLRALLEPVVVCLDVGGAFSAKLAPGRFTASRWSKHGGPPM